MVYRIYVEKKKGIGNHCESLLNELRNFLLVDVEELRILNVYDVENVSKELFDYCAKNLFAEPQTDITSETLDTNGWIAFATEYLPGQFDQRADSAQQCIRIIAKVENPVVKTSKVYLMKGNLSEQDVEKIKKHVINPVECRQTEVNVVPETLEQNYAIPEDVAILNGFIDATESQLAQMLKNYSLAMDLDDLKFCQEYFKSERRDPTMTELRVIDTYWSDHCRHTTFLTTIDKVTFEDKQVEQAFERYLQTRKQINRTKPINLMDVATICARYFSKTGKLDKQEQSREINACSVKIEVEVNGKKEPWLLMFKNETHNHPTEIEPFGGAATCIGGAIRDPLSGRSYVYAAMRITGASDPLNKNTLKGKLPQRKIVTNATNGYSSYGNQIGLSTGIVDEIYHDGYSAKHMEIGAVLAAAPQKNVFRGEPKAGDVIILLGGRTGRDGCGGATGSSKSHTEESLNSCGAEVQKGNAPEERKIQRLFRNETAAQMIVCCNDFGAGGISVAIGELADGVEVNLNNVKKKYEGLDGTELAISESQERMAVVIEKKNVEKFLALAEQENLEATQVAEVTELARLKMHWNGKTIVDISREFLSSNGAEKHVEIEVEKAQSFSKETKGDFVQSYKELCSDLNVCSKRGLGETFDSTIGAGTVLMPFGGKYQRTPIQAMAHKIPVLGQTDDCSLMSWGYNPFISEKSPFAGAYLAVVESVAKLIATGADFKDIYLTFQEYFPRLNKDSKKWGLPFASLLGAYSAQMDLQIASIGGKDSMSGTFENISVPPTLVSFAVTTSKTQNVVANHFKNANSKVVLLKCDVDENGICNHESFVNNAKLVVELLKNKKAITAYTPCYGGVAEAIYKQCIGNGFGFEYSQELSQNEIFDYCYGSFVLELADGVEVENAIVLGKTTTEQTIKHKDSTIQMSVLNDLYENKLESVYHYQAPENSKKAETFSYQATTKLVCNTIVSKPKVVIPVFPGTNCEYDTAKQFEFAGADVDVFVVKNLTRDKIEQSVEEFAKKVSQSQMVFIPGGFSAGDEPDGSGKFITAFFKNPAIKEQVHNLLNNRDGLIGGICNGFQALVKLGLVPFGKIIDVDQDCPTLTFNSIGRHQSKLVNVRVASNKSPWLSATNVGDVFKVAISHGEGRFVCNDKVLKELVENGQIATQYVDFENKATYNVDFNPNNSICAIEGVTSKDGRVFGKMGHSERIGNGLYKNVEAEFDMKMFQSAVQYFKK